MASSATASIYDTITKQIIAALERGTGDYTLPWHLDELRHCHAATIVENSYRRLRRSRVRQYLDFAGTCSDRIVNNIRERSFG